MLHTLHYVAKGTQVTAFSHCERRPTLDSAQRAPRTKRIRIAVVSGNTIKMLGGFHPRLIAAMSRYPWPIQRENLDLRTCENGIADLRAFFAARGDWPPMADIR